MVSTFLVSSRHHPLRGETKPSWMLVAAKDRTIIHDLERWYTSGKLTLVAGQALATQSTSRTSPPLISFGATCREQQKQCLQGGTVRTRLRKPEISDGANHLLLNACQAATRSTHAPEVKVHLTEVDEQICVTISDNGPGIPASVRRILFDPFVTAARPNGTGLGGFTLARRIAEEHGGSIRLKESNRERTVFTLSLTKTRSLIST
jgi:hypothetical protein